MTVLSVTLNDSVATFRLNDPKRRNALSASMLSELIAAFDALTIDTRVVVLRAGLEDSVWCAGFDIKSLEPGFDPLASDGLLQTLFTRISDCSVPVVGMIHGSAWGGGTDLALRCDILVGDPSAEFAFTPAKLGLPYDKSGLLNAFFRVGPGLAMEMFATAQPIQAERAFRSGILGHLVDAKELETFTVSLTRTIAENAPLTVASAKRHLRAFTAAIALPGATSNALTESRARALSSDDYAEGIAAFMAKRKPRFTGR